jgi:hypothetical protein
LPSWQTSHATRLVTADAQAATGVVQNGHNDVLDEADAYFSSINNQSAGNDGFAHSPIGGPMGGAGQMYVVNQGQGLGTMNSTQHVQNGEGDLLSF